LPLAAPVPPSEHNHARYDAESQIKYVINNSVTTTYLYDGSGRRVSKSSGKLYWYGSGGEILAESDASRQLLPFSRLPRVSFE